MFFSPFYGCHVLSRVGLAGLLPGPFEGEQGHLQGVRDDLQEAPGAGRTLVVDDEVLHFAPLV